MDKVEKCCVNEAIISREEIDSNFGQNKCIITGRSKTGEIRSLFELCFNSVEKLNNCNKEIKKIELCLYLQDLKIGINNDAFMLNIGINTKEYNSSNITYNTAPPFYQECHIYKIKKQFINKYINLDITQIVDNWNNKTYPKCGCTIMGLNSEAIAIFGSSSAVKKPYLKIYYNNQSNEYVENNTTKAYGVFSNVTGECITKQGKSIILWDSNEVSSGIILDNKQIIIRDKGVYRVDYYMNARCNCYTTTQLVLNEKGIESSKRQIGATDCPSTGSILIEVIENNSKLDLIINNENIMLVNIGVCSSLSISKL